MSLSSDGFWQTETLLRFPDADPKEASGKDKTCAVNSLKQFWVPFYQQLPFLLKASSSALLLCSLVADVILLTTFVL